jgi:hypothetical protein
VFTATGMDGVGIKALVDAAHASGVAALPNTQPGQTDRYQVACLDGSTSVTLAHSNPDRVLTIDCAGAKHRGWKYYINIYLMFVCDQPRN